MSPKLDRPAPPYQQIAETIRRRILSGELKAGDHVPSVRAIINDYGVAMATAQRALGALRAEGLILSERGIGSVVTTEEERGRSASDRLYRSRQTGKVYPTGQHARIVEAGVVEASAEIADALGVEAGEPVVRRVRVTYREDDQPSSMSTSWFRGEAADVAPDLLTTKRIEAGTFAYLAAALGRTLDGWQDQFEASLATAEDATHLGISEGSPVLRGRNWFFDDTGMVIEYGESVSTRRTTYRGRLSD